MRKANTPSGRPLAPSDVLKRVAELPDTAICHASKASWYGWYAAVDTKERYVGDPDFARSAKTRKAAVAACARSVREDLRGEGNRYAPHWGPYDVEYRLLPHWERRMRRAKSTPQR